jgi:hypothetical protein
MLCTKECASIPFSSVVFILGFAFEYFKEFGGVSITITITTSRKHVRENKRI